MNHTHTVLVRLACLSLFSIAGCASSRDNASASADADPGKVCTREYPTGSNLPIVTCRSARTEAERLQDMDNARRTMPTGPIVMPRTGTGG